MVYTPILCQHAFDPDAEVRDSACAALGAIQKCIGEKALAMFLSNNLTADPTKMAKVYQYLYRIFIHNKK
jgi:hypothetical protein